ncbi:MAG: PorP/SprF family type IX secretion system membrane protein [Prevotellaceae bacterium]|jgi:type IX secretion system PorP/SprF family membrane protein|nr:PorP/SprF family type IX secretion system membrane protein [Prevotellaceae bacterium]
MKKPYRLIVSLSLLLATVITLPAQDGFDNNHKWLNRSLMNPAATGNTNYFEASAIARKQWIGMEGAPGLLFLNAQNLFAPMSSGAGFTLINDYIGFYNTLNAKLSYAYHLKLGTKMALSFGLAGGLLTQGRDDASVRLNDMAEYAAYERTLLPDFDTGVEFRYEGIRAGLSALHLNIDSEKVEYAYSRAFNAYASIRVDINEMVTIMPLALVSYTSERFNGESGAIVYFRFPRKSVSLERLDRTVKDRYDRFWIGANAGWLGNIQAMGGLFITEQWRLGYSFGYTWNLRSVKAATSHEILLSWRIKTSEPRRYLCLDDCE